jgi:DNA-binding NarL/FixJ family response regulator
MTANPPGKLAGKKKCVLLVDDHPVLRRGIAALIDGEADLSICGEAGTMQEAMAMVSKSKPDMMIVDVSLDGNNGIELVKNLRGRYKSLPILVYSMHDESIYSERALRAGASGYVMKESKPDVLLTAIREVLKGKIYLSESMSARMLGRMVGAGRNDVKSGSPVDKLSDRELEVLQLLGKGLGTAQIADKLCLSIKTIETYREHLKQKLNLANGQELLRFAIEWSLDQANQPGIRYAAEEL